MWPRWTRWSRWTARSRAAVDFTQPFEGGWLFPCKFRVACPEANMWLYRAAWRREDGPARTTCPVDALIAYHGDLLCLSQQIVARIAGLKGEEVDATDADDGCLRQAG